MPGQRSDDGGLTNRRQVSKFERYVRIPGSEYIDFWPAGGAAAVLPIPTLRDDEDYDLGDIGL